MTTGRFRCLGTPRHLKNKFSNVYTLTAKIKMDKNEGKLEEFKEFIATKFPGNIGRTDVTIVLSHGCHENNCIAVHNNMNES